MGTKKLDIKGIAVNTFRQWQDVEAPRMGAALAFYTMLSLGPLLLLMVSVAGLVFDPNQVRGSLMSQIGALVGKEGAEAVNTILTKASEQKTSGTIATIFGLVTLLLGASSVALELRSALNKIYALKEAAGVTEMLKVRSYAVALVLGAGFLLLVSLIVSAGLSAFGGQLNAMLAMPASVLEILNFVISLVIFSAVFAAIFKLLPSRSPAWSDVRLGAILTAVLFMIGKTLIGVYLGKAGISSAYGAAGSLVALLVWIYYSAQILFMGAEFIKVYAESRGAALEPKTNRTSSAGSVARQS